VKGSFFFSVGPDNMGRHLWRLLRPTFLLKMLRTRAAGLYGWDIILRGTLLPGPLIGRKLGDTIRRAADVGHEIGLHAWDHHAWQQHVAAMHDFQIRNTLKWGMDLLTEIVGRPPTCSAAPAWRCTDPVLVEKLEFPFEYNSDCRGEAIFQPVVRGQPLGQPQIPTTLPTYDEAIGRDGIDDRNYNEFLFRQLRPGKLNTLTIHAEAEGIACRALFRRFLQMAREREVHLLPLSQLLQMEPRPLPRSVITSTTVPGRDGWISCQGRVPER
jgi:undecaprenyl phosphate-alpha-L-ara4FN deformylase